MPEKDPLGILNKDSKVDNNDPLGILKKKETSVSDGEPEKPTVSSDTEEVEVASSLDISDLPSKYKRGQAKQAQQSVIKRKKGYTGSGDMPGKLKYADVVEEPKQVEEGKVYGSLPGESGVQYKLSNGKWYARNNAFSVRDGLPSRWSEVDDIEKVEMLDDRIGVDPNQMKIREKSERIESIPDNIIEADESQLSEYLQSQFGDYGLMMFGDEIIDYRGRAFKFERTESGIKKLKEFLSALDPDEYEMTERMSVQEHNAWKLDQYLKDQESLGGDAYDIVKSTIDRNLKGLKEEKNALLIDKENLDRKIADNGGVITLELQKEIDTQKVRAEQILEDVKYLSGRTDQVETAAALLAEKKYKEDEKKGSFWGAMRNKFLEGVGGFSQTGGSMSANVLPYLLPNAGMPEIEYQKLKDQGLSDEEIRDVAKKDILSQTQEDLKYGLSDLIGSETTQAYMQSEDRGMFEQAMMGLAETAPALIGGGRSKGLQLLTLAAQSYGHIESEMANNPEFDDVSENEKKLISIPYAIGMGYLERLGFTELLSKNPAAKSLLNKAIGGALKKTSKNATADVIEKSIIDEIDNAFAKGVYKIAGGTIVEAETGAIQEASELQLKEIYNTIKGKDMFDAPTLASWEGLKTVGEGAVLEGIGGAVMKATSNAANVVRDGISGSDIDNDVAQLLRDFSDDPELRSITSTYLQTKVLAGEMTVDQAKETMASYDEMMGTMGKIPGDTEEVSKTYDLITEKNKLEAEMKGKDKSTVTKQQRRVDEINEEIKKINDPEAVEEVDDGVRTADGADTEVDVTPETSSNYANLTEDNEGNFVFFHVGGPGYETIKKASGATTATSREEASALSKVGGLAMYYTSPSEGESMVTGSHRYAVKIPKSKVYDFNTDSKNFIEEARKRFESEHPGKAFTPNDQVAYVAQIAGEAPYNYEMVVSEWDGRTRAQSTKEHVPSDVEVKKGQRITQSFKEEYVSNKDKGYESVIPESKESKLKSVYDKIYKERNAEGRYDDLYHLAENAPKKTQGEITELIESSDLSEDLKNEYREVIAYEPESRRSYINTNKKQTILHSSEGGSSVNQKGENLSGKPGFSVSVHPDRTKTIKGREITEEQLSSFKEENSDLLEDENNFVGTWYDSESGDTYLDVSTYVKNKEEAVRMGTDANQKAIFNLETKEEISTEGTGEFIEDKKITPEEAAEKRKTEGIYTSEGKGKVRQSLESWKRRMTSARRFMPKSVFKSKDSRESGIAKSLNIAEKNIKDFNRLFKKVDEANKDTVLEAFDKHIRGDETIDLPEGFGEIANSMRNQVDALSQMLLDAGVVTGESAQNIKDNIGTYLTRSYEVHTNKDWKKQVTEEVKNRAKNYLREQYKQMAIDQTDGSPEAVESYLENMVDLEIDKLITGEENNFFPGGKEGSKDLGILKERKDIPEEIRALMGEVSDPALNYAHTVLKMSALAYNHKFLTEVREAGLGVFLFEKTDQRPVEFNTKIAAEGSESMNPLNGLYTTKEIAEEFNKQPEQLGAFMRTYMKMISTVKWAKTIGSVATHSKNITGNLGFVWLNGHYRLNEMRGAYKTVMNDFKSGSKKGLREKMNKYIELGIVKQSAGLNEIRDMFKDAEWDNAMAERLTNRKLNSGQKVKRFVAQTKKGLEDAYQAEDDFFKIVAYENELSRYSKAMFGKNKRDLTAEEQSKVDEVVAEIVKNTYPTYDRVPEMIQKIRRFPLIGNFVSFQAESYRTAYNTAHLAKQELMSKDKEIRKIGSQRLMGAMSYMSAKSAILTYFSMAAGTGAVGIFGDLFDDEEEKQKERDVREFVAPWSKKSDLVIMQAGDGKVKYIDFSASDPHGALHKVINAALLEDGIGDRTIAAIAEIIEPFGGTEITTAAVADLYKNEDAYGKQIWNPTDSKPDQIKDVMAFVWKVIQPGTVTSVNRVIKSDDPVSEIGAALSGFRIIETDVNEQFGFRVRDIMDQLTDAKRPYNRSIRQKERGEDVDVKSEYDKANSKYKEYYQEVIDIYNSAERLGVKPEDLSERMKQFGISKYMIEQVQNGKIEDMPEGGNKKKKKPVYVPQQF